MLAHMNKMVTIAADGMTPQQQLFADTYLQTSSAERSAIAAGYSPKSARTTGPRTLRIAAVAAYIAKHQEIRTRAAEKLEARLVNELENIAFSNIGDLINVDDEGLPQIDFSRATRAQLAAVNSVSTKRTKRYDGKGKHIATEVNAKFGLSSKQEAIKTLMQFKGMLKPEEHRVTLDVSDRLLRARDRIPMQGAEDAAIEGVVASVSEKPGGGGTGV